MDLFEFVFDAIFDRLGFIGGLLVMFVLVPTMVYLPMMSFVAFGDRRKAAAAGTGPGPSVTLKALVVLSSIYYCYLFVFLLVPYTFGTVVPGIWRFVTALLPFAQGLFSGTSGLILSALASVVGLVLFFVVAGWAFRLGWRLQDRIR